MTEKQRLIPVDIMVGLAMTLVVLGHQSFPFCADWYYHGMMQWIYRFHMELFVFLSAFLIRYSYKPTNYFRYIGRKAKKFLLPFVLVGVAVAAAKCWSLGLEKGDAWSYMWWQIKRLALYPMQSEASFLWYIYVLMGYYLVSPLVVRMPQWLKMALCLISMGLPLLGAGHLLGGYLFCRYTFFYFLGILCAEGWEQLKELKTWLLGLLSLPFVAWSVKFLLSESTFLEVGPEHFDLLSGCLSLPFFYFLARVIIKIDWLTRALSRIARDCFWIYLLQMFFIWALGLGLQAAGLTERIPFALFLVGSTAFGLLGPMACSWLSQKITPSKLSRKRKKSKKK